jgi:hypothetical protein
VASLAFAETVQRSSRVSFQSRSGINRAAHIGTYLSVRSST